MSAAFKNLRKRVFSALFLTPLVLAFTFLGGIVFNISIIIAAAIMAKEWNNITLKTKKKKAKSHTRQWVTLGLLYIALPCLCLIWLRHNPDGLQLILWLFIVVWATDIGAYFSGKYIGGPKLCPAISPNKTWVGAIGGVLTAGFMGSGMVLDVLGLTVHAKEFVAGSEFSFFAVFISIISQLGDMFESWVKRKFDVKDSGTIIPGHGGLLDRVDGLLTTIPVLTLWLVIFG